MEHPATSVLRIGEWRVDPVSSQISRDGKTTRLEVRAMRLLLCLAENPGQVVSIDDLISHVWGGIAVSPDSVYQAVTALRRQLGDDSRQPAYIETAPRLGYRMVAPVSLWSEPPEPATTAPGSPPMPHGRPPVSPAPRLHPAVRLLGAFGAVVLAVIAGFFIHARLASKSQAAVNASPPQESIAVLPFLDLTEGMSNEELADGMTEELIDRLSKIQPLRVSSATSSFYYKNKRIPVADIAKALGVVYILDGSVRKSSNRIRVAARLVRAENGFVLWTESYDRPPGDLLWVQEDIASEVAKALRSSFVTSPQVGNP
jgi:transcriptional activator of cad operon